MNLFTTADVRVYVSADEEYSSDGLAAVIADIIADHLPGVISVYRLRNDGFATQEDKPLA